MAKVTYSGMIIFFSSEKKEEEKEHEVRGKFQQIAPVLHGNRRENYELLGI
ncbi:hypothetical protein VU02_04620 [Desulfobulbus sp. N2]|nr:hypothetical protein [Desulfobulbus sp. N2]